MDNETAKAETVPSSEPGNPGATESSAGAALDFDVAAHIEALTQERDQLAREKSDLHDMLLRRTAEFDNFRKRTERERADLIDSASTQAVKAMLPVLDDLERALRLEGTETEFARGVQLIYQRMFDSLKKLGLEPIAAEGQPFDPNLHHGIEMVETDEAEDQTVLADLMRGYLFKGKLLRPSMVKVAVRK